MAQIIGYGEDPLTYWVMAFKLDVFLQRLGDDPPDQDTLVLYKPSFGRRGRAKEAVRSLAEELGVLRIVPRAEFGEFDAIVGTRKKVYLVETKWGCSSEFQGGWIELREEQVHRHDVFHWYREQWTRLLPINWASFVELGDGEFRQRFPRNKMAPVGSRLAQNLQFVLSQLAPCGPDVEDVLLYIKQAADPVLAGVGPPRFRPVTIDYETIPGSSYFIMSGIGAGF